MFWERARTSYNGHGITVLRVITDNGSSYRSRGFNDALGVGVKDKFTCPYRSRPSELLRIPPGSTNTITTERTAASGASRHPTRSQRHGEVR